MTFLFGTNMELLYSMPASGTTITSAIKSLATGNTATNPPFQLPAFQNIWPVSALVGRGLMFMASGGFDIASTTPTTLTLTLDGTAATQGLYTVATTGSAAWTTTAVGMWEAQAWMTCVSTGTVSTWYSSGQLTVGPSSAETSTAITYMWGGNVNAGIPQPVTIPTNTPLYPEIYATWATAPTAFVCTQFMIFGLD